MNAQMAPMTHPGVSGGAGALQRNGLPLPSSTDDEAISGLNTKVYEYLVKHQLWDSARAFLREAAGIQTDPNPVKLSPGRRRDADGMIVSNGVDGTEMIKDAGPARPNDLPAPDNKEQKESLLLTWWGLFSDIVRARQRGNEGGGLAAAYIQVQVNYLIHQPG